MTRDPMFRDLPKNELSLDPGVKADIEKLPKKPKKEPPARDPMFRDQPPNELKPPKVR